LWPWSVPRRLIGGGLLCETWGNELPRRRASLQLRIMAPIVCARDFPMEQSSHSAHPFCRFITRSRLQNGVLCPILVVLCSYWMHLYVLLRPKLNRINFVLQRIVLPQQSSQKCTLIASLRLLQQTRRGLARQTLARPLRLLHPIA